MAILAHIPGVDVTVFLNSRSLREYKNAHIPEEDTFTIVRYIEVRENYEFSVPITVNTREAVFLRDALVFDIWVVGQPIAKMSLQNTRAKDIQLGCTELPVFGPAYGTLVRPMKFAPLRAVEGGQDEESNDVNLHDLRSIVEISHGWET